MLRVQRGLGRWVHSLPSRGALSPPGRLHRRVPSVSLRRLRLLVRVLRCKLRDVQRAEPQRMHELRARNSPPCRRHVHVHVRLRVDCRLVHADRRMRNRRAQLLRCQPVHRSCRFIQLQVSRGLHRRWRELRRRGRVRGRDAPVLCARDVHQSCRRSRHARVRLRVHHVRLWWRWVLLWRSGRVHARGTDCDNAAAQLPRRRQLRQPRCLLQLHVQIGLPRRRCQRMHRY